MLYYLTRARSAVTIEDFLASFGRCGVTPPAFIQPLRYETLFSSMRAPVGNYVFTDLDRLSDYEIDAAAQIAYAVQGADSGAAIINWPHRVLGRYALLRRLYETGVNSFNLWRLDECRLPTAYPVFIRRERGAYGPETPLLHNEGEFRMAVQALQDSGKGLGGRVAVEFRQSPDHSGVYRKYGAFCFRGEVVSHHLFMSKSWNVKRSTLALSPEMIEEEERYVFDNPHAEQIRKVFELAQTDFGRIDYALVHGRLEVFEINTNPTFPRMRLDRPERARRRHHSVAGVVAGFRTFDQSVASKGLVRFEAPRPKVHLLRGRRLRSRIRDVITAAKRRLFSAIGRI